MAIFSSICGPLAVTLALAGLQRDEERCPACAARDEAREVLAEADQNRDGKLDLDELAAWIEHCRAEEDEEGYEDEDEEGWDEDEDEDALVRPVAPSPASV